DEFGLANPARTELHVGREVAAHHLVADLAMDVAQALVRIEVQVFAKDERCYKGFELVMPRAGQRPRLEPGIPFPGATLGDQVLLERCKRHRGRTAFAVRSQAHVDAKYKAVSSCVVERSGDAPAQAVEKFLIGQRSCTVRL